MLARPGPILSKNKRNPLLLKKGWNMKGIHKAAFLLVALMLLVSSLAPAPAAVAQEPGPTPESQNEAPESSSPEAARKLFLPSIQMRGLSGGGFYDWANTKNDWAMAGANP